MRAAHRCLTCAGAGRTMSRRPSPSRLKQNTASISVSLETRDPPSPDTMKEAPSATMMPHSGVGGRTPRPVNDRPAALGWRTPGQRDLHHHDRHDVGQDLGEQDARLAVAGEPRGKNEAGVAPHIGFGAARPRIEREVMIAVADDDVVTVLPSAATMPMARTKSGKAMMVSARRPTMRSVSRRKNRRGCRRCRPVRTPARPTRWRWSVEAAARRRG